DRLQAEYFLDVGDAEHLAGGHAGRAVAGQQQVRGQRLAGLGAAGLGIQQADDAVGVTHRGHFRVDHDHRLVGEVHGQERALLDAGRRVAHDVLEAVGGQVLEDLLDALLGEGILVAGLRGGQHVEVVEALVLDQGLLERGLAVDDVDEVVNHAALAAHDQVEVAQADVEVDDRGLVAAPGQADGDAGAGGGLADAALAGSDYDDFSQWRSPWRYLQGRRWQRHGGRRPARVSRGRPASAVRLQAIPARPCRAGFRGYRPVPCSGRQWPPARR